MAESKIWTVDEIAAINLARALGLSLGEEQLAIAADHLAEHRVTALDLAASRIRSRILDRIHQARLAAHTRRSADWSDGCMSAEQAILAMTSADMLEITPSAESSRGQVLRTMIRHTRKTLATNV